MRLVLHIGTGKTASSLLQRWLYANRERLGTSGVFLPVGLSKPNNFLLPGYFSTALPFYLQETGIATVTQKGERFGHFLSKFSHEFDTARASHRTAVITSEHLYYLKEAEVSDLQLFLQEVFDSIEVVCYFREPISHAVSSYSEKLRGRRGQSEGVEDFVRQKLKGNVYNYQLIVDKWASIFGEHNFHPRLFESEFLFGGDIRRDFMSIVAPKVPASRLDWSISSARESVSGLQAAALRGVNRLVPVSESVRDVETEVHKNLSRVIAESSALKVGKVSLKPTLADQSRSRELTAEFLERNFPADVRFSDYSAQPEEQTVPLSIAELAVEEAITIGFEAGQSLTPPQVKLMRDIAVRLASRKKIGADAIAELVSICLQLRPDDALLARASEEWSPAGRITWFRKLVHRRKTR